MTTGKFAGKLHYGKQYHAIKRLGMSTDELARNAQWCIDVGMTTSASFFVLLLVRKIGPAPAVKQLGAINVRMMLAIAHLAVSKPKFQQFAF